MFDLLILSQVNMGMSEDNQPIYGQLHSINLGSNTKPAGQDLSKHLP